MHRSRTAPGTGCWDINWPSKRTGAGFQVWGASYPDLPEQWRGSLVQDQGDRGGLLYKRNRYYDPATGRFTQVDPIGIGGGSNVYGFASGDPVNFADPFGLCVPPDSPECRLISMVAANTRGLIHLQPAMLAIASLPTFGLGGGISSEVLAMGNGLRASVSGLLRAGGVAERVAGAVGGTVGALGKSEGFKVTIEGAKDIVVRIKATGEMRVSIDRLGSLTREGVISSDRALTHLRDVSSQELIGLVDKARALVGVPK